MKPDPSAVEAQAVQHNGHVRATSNSVTQKSGFNMQNQSNENTAVGIHALWTSSPVPSTAVKSPYCC